MKYSISKTAIAAAACLPILGTYAAHAHLVAHEAGADDVAYHWAFAGTTCEAVSASVKKYNQGVKDESCTPVDDVTFSYDFKVPVWVEGEVQDYSQVPHAFKEATGTACNDMNLDQLKDIQDDPVGFCEFASSHKRRQAELRPTRTKRKTGHAHLDSLKEIEGGYHWVWLGAGLECSAVAAALRSRFTSYPADDGFLKCDKVDDVTASFTFDSPANSAGEDHGLVAVAFQDLTGQACDDFALPDWLVRACEPPSPVTTPGLGTPLAKA